MKIFEIEAWGHPNIKATHKTTFEITKEDFLTEKGDCIIGVKASHSCKDLPKDLKEYLKSGKKIRIVLESDGIKDEVIAYGSRDLILENPISIVVRKSEYIDDRTLAIRSNKASKDLNRKLIEKLKEGKKLVFKIYYFI